MMKVLFALKNIVGFKFYCLFRAVYDLQVLPKTVICPLLDKYQLLVAPRVIMCSCLQVVHITHTVSTVARAHEAQWVFGYLCDS